MRMRRSGPTALSLRLPSLAILALLTMTAMARATQDQPAPAEEPAAAPAVSISFSFKDAPLDQVVDYFARQTGLPVIREAEVPTGTVTFISTRQYGLEDGMRVLNTILQTRGVMLRRDAEFLYLQKLDNMKAESVPTYADGEIPESVTDEQVISTVIVLKNAPAAQVAEKMAPLVAPYGAMIALPQQNAVIITETAGQCRRLASIISSLDERPMFEESVKLFPLRHVKAADALSSLKVLVAEKKTTVVIDQQGNRRTISEDEIVGLRIEADQRTNSIIAVGPEGRLRTIERLIELLDVPEAVGTAMGGGAGSGREMATFEVSVAEPGAAAERVKALFAKLPPEEQPVLLALPEVSKIVMVGTSAQVAQARAFVDEIEGRSPGGAGATAPGAVLLPLAHLDADRALSTLKSVMNARQQRLLRLAPAPDGKGIVVTGPEADLAAVRRMLSAIDVPGAEAREARLLKLTERVNSELLAKAAELHERTRGGDGDAVQLEIDEESGTATLIGSRTALDRFARLIDDAARVAVPAPSAQIVDVKVAKAADVLTAVRELLDAAPLRDAGRRLPEPSLSLIERTNSILVVAEPAQHAVITEFIRRLDVPEPTKLPPLKLLQVRTADAAAIAQMLSEQYDRRPPGERQEKPVAVRADAATNTLIVSAHADLLTEITQFVEDVNRASAEQGQRVTEIFPLRMAKAAEVATAMERLFPEPPMPVDRLGRPQPWLKEPKEVNVSADPASNSLIVDAPISRMEAFRALVEKLDRVELPPQAQLRTYRVTRADFDAVVSSLRGLASRGALSGAAEPGKPAVAVSIEAEPRTKTLIVAGDSTTFERVEQVLKEFESRPATPESELLFFALANARAERVQPLARDVLTARLRQEMEREGRPPGEAAALIQVSADRPSNTLIVSVPITLAQEARELIARLDAAKPGESAGARRDIVKIVPLAHAEPAAAATALRESLSKTDMPSGGTGADVSVAAASSTSALVVSGDERDVEFVCGLAAQIDVPPVKDSVATATVVLKHARAEAVAPLVEKLFQTDQLPDWARLNVRLNRQGFKPEVVLRVAADARLNAVVLTGPQDAITVAQEIVEQLDVARGAAPGAERSVRILTLENADAQAAAASIEAVFKDAADTGEAPPLIKVDAASNSLIVRASAAQLEQVESLVRGIDGATLVASRQLRTVAVDRSRMDAAAMADMLRRVLESRGGVRVRVIDAADLLPESEREGAAPAGKSSNDQSRRGVLLPGRVRYVIGFVQTVVAAAQIEAQADAGKAPEAQGASETEVTIAVDPETNSLIILGSSRATEQIAELSRLLESSLPAEPSQVRVINLPAGVDGRSLASTIQTAVGAIGQLSEQNPGGMTGRVVVVSDPAGEALIVAANDTDFEVIRPLVAALSRPEARELPVHSIKLERADAQTVAAALTRFFDDRARASGRPGQQALRRVAVVGDRRSSTLIVSAREEDLDEVKSLVATFDAPAAARDLQFRVIPLQHVRVSDIAETVQSLAFELQWMNSPWNRGNEVAGDKITLESDTRTNSIIVMGEGESFNTIESIVKALDVPRPDQASVVVKVFKVQRADLGVVRRAAEQAFSDPNQSRRWWEPADPQAMRFETDGGTRSLIAIGPLAEMERVGALVAQLDSAMEGGDRTVEIVPLAFADAARVAESLSRFFTDRARLTGLERPAVSVIGSPEGNTLILTAAADDMALARDIVARLDVQELSDGREIEVYALKHGEASDIAQAIERLFPRAGSGSAERRVVVSADIRTNSLIVSAPKDAVTRVQALIEQMDAPAAGDAVTLRTFALQAARAEEAARTLREALDLTDTAQGRARAMQGDVRKFLDESGEPVEVKAKITADRRSNSLIVAADDKSMTLVAKLIAQLDEQPAVSETEYRVIALKHAMASDVASTMRSLLAGRRRAQGEPEPAVSHSRRDNTLIVSATSDQLAEIEKILKEVDVPSRVARKTEFVPLEFADAVQVQEALSMFYGRFAPEAETPGSRNVSIVADPASNSLVISADETEWRGIRELVDKLDSEEYDASRQLVVIPLLHADATSVAATLSEAFTAPLKAELERERERAREQARQRGRPEDDVQVPALLVDSDEVISVSAEPLTNSLVVSASRKELERIRAIVAQIDVPGFANLPAPQVIPLRIGKASEVARSVQQMYELSEPGRSGGGGRGLRSVSVVGDDASNALIVRADEQQFAQIKALADVLQQTGESAQVTVRVIRLHSQPASRLAQTVLRTFQASAQQRREPLAVEADRRGNALVIASSKPLFEEIEKVVRELDGPAPEDQQGAAAPLGLPNQGLFVFDLENSSPEDVRRTLEQMGLTREPTGDRPGVLSEPITVVALTSRRAVAITAAPGDGETIRELVAAIDAAPVLAEQEMALVGLKTAQAPAVVQILERALSTTDNDSKSKLAASIAEQVRRLNLRGEGMDDRDVSLDLSVPIRVEAEPASNSVLVVSSAANVAALRTLIGMLDRLPAADAVILRIFHLNNASATRLAAVVRQLYSQGDALRRAPGSEVRGLPTTETGKALASSIAVAVDDRTNALIVGGREEAVGLVEVLIRELDSEEVSNWIEPRVVTLRFADATKLAETLDRVLVDGLGEAPEDAAIRRQIGRLRMLRDGVPNAAAPGAAADAAKIESEIFAPMTKLVILPEPALNALIVIGATANVEIVCELVKMLDVEGASRFDMVRVYPLQHAAADRVADVLQSLFRQQVANESLRPEDDLVIQSDVRTNSLVIATSARSFAVIDTLLKTLDSENVNPTVGLHILSVGNNSARLLAPKVEQLMRDRMRGVPQGAATARDVVSIQADEATNTLIVAASDENLKLIRELVDILAKTDPTAAEKLEIFALRSARAPDMIDLLNELYANEVNRTRGQGTLRLRAEERLNAVVVNGLPVDIERIRELIERLDGAALEAVREIRIVSLKSANALEMVNLLENVLSGRSVAGARTAARQATLLRFVREQAGSGVAQEAGREPTEAEVSSAIREQVTLTPDMRTNAVIVSAPASMMVLIESLIEDLESSASGSREIAVFALENADATNMAELLRDLFNLRQQGNLYVLVPTGTGAPDASQTPADADETAPGSNLAMGDMTLTVVPDERQQLAITVDARTNSLLVSGTPKYLELVQRVVTELDAQKGTEREQITYELKSARVEEVAQALQTFIDQEQDRIERALGPDRAGSALRRLEQEISVVGVPGSSRLILSASPRYMDKVLALVEELDRAPAQVLIQVLLAEVTLDHEETWGVDFELISEGSRELNLLTRAAGTGVLTAIGVPNLSVSTLDFDLLIRALEVQGRLEVLSRPQILVNDNEDAEIQVGEDIQLVTDVQRTDAGNTISTVDTREIGVILKVTPSIAPDGFVRLDIAPEISALTDRTTQISEDFEAPIITKRRADTTVTVNDGQTIVIGGLIQTENESRKSKVPLLGDIPLIGSVFRSEKVSGRKTELMIILTPRVIMTDRDLREVSAEEIDRLSIPEDIKEVLRSNRINNGASAGSDQRGEGEQRWKTTIRTGEEIDRSPEPAPIDLPSDAEGAGTEPPVQPAEPTPGEGG